MGLEIAAAVISAAAAVGGKVIEMSAAEDAANAVEESNRVKRASEENRARDARRQKLREQRVARAKLEAVAAATGTSKSSGVAGAAAGLQAGFDSFSSSLGESRKTADGLGRIGQSGADAQSRGAVAGAVSSLGAGAFQLAAPGAFQEASSAFKTAPVKTVTPKGSAVIGNNSIT